MRDYNKFNREKWGLLPPGASFSPPPIERGPSITLIVRKGDNMRVYANERAVIQALTDIPGAGELRVVDFASIAFEEQVALAHNTRYEHIAHLSSKS